jgi:PKD repeat protein
MNIFLRLIILVLLLTRLPFIAEGQRTTGGTPKSFTIDKNKRKLGEPSIPVNTVPVIDNNAELEKAKKLSPNIYGLLNAVNVDIIKQGFKEALPDGGTLWRYKISSSTAYSMEVVFSRFHLPNKAQLFIYNEDHSVVLGALSSLNNSAQGTLATQPIFGSSIIIEYYEPSNIEFHGEVVIGEVVHDFANVLQFVKGQGPFVPVGDYRDVSCIKNVSCPEAQPYADQAKAVALILYKMPSGKYVGHATGTLINNSENDGQPYFLTAYHNIDELNADCSDSTDLCFDYSKWVVLFNHYDPDCNGTGQSVSSSVINSVTGAKRLSGDRDKDYLLLRLNSTPENVCYAGWSRSSSPLPPFVDIHHPLGDVKKISFYNRQLDSALPNYWLVDNWNSGYTSQGSSGSALFDNNKRIVGVLNSGTGGDYCEADPNFNPRTDPVPDPNNPPVTASSFFGRFSTSFDHGHFGVYLGNVEQTDTYCPVVQACPGNNQRQMRTGAQMRTMSTCMEVNFSVNKTEAIVNQQITFENQSSGGVGEVRYEWDFGVDAVPATSTEEAPSAVYYTSTGNKWVTLTVCDDAGCITEQKASYIDVQNSSSTMLVGFTSDKRAVTIGEEIKFTSTVSGNQTSAAYLWNFGEGAEASSLVTANPTVTYSSPGPKTISLQVTENNGIVTEIKNAFITVAEPNTLALKADFSGCLPGALGTGTRLELLNITMGGSGFPYTSYLWDFGDGVTATTQNANHVYNEIGSYTVSLTVCDGDNCDKKTSEACVNISKPTNAIGEFYINGMMFTIGGPKIVVGMNRPVVFSNALSQWPNTDYRWNFDASGMSLQKFATPYEANTFGPHTVFYTQPGVYSASLTVQNYVPMPLTVYKTVMKNDAIQVLTGMGAGDCKAVLGDVSLSTTCWSKGAYPEFTAVVNSNTCPYVIRVKSANTGQFLTNNKIDFNNGLNPPVFPYTDTYTISVTHYDGVSYTLLDSKSMTVTLYNSGANAGADIAVCPGNELQLGSASKPNTSYIWSCIPSTGVNHLSNSTISNPKFNTVFPGTYNYVVNAKDLTSGCVTSDDVKVTIQPVTVGNKTYNTCMGGIETLSLPVAGGAGSYTGVWTPSTYLTNANILNPNIQAPQTGTTLLYNLTVTDSKGCKATGTALVEVSAVAPSGLVTVGGFKEVKLTWIDNSSTETAFVVERSTSSSSGFVVITILVGNTTTYTDKTAALGVTYYYRVYAKNATTPNLGTSNTSSAYTNLPVSWNKTYGGDAAETDAKIYPTADGGYIVGSTSASNVGGDVSDNHFSGTGVNRIGGLTTMWIVKLDACGNKTWDKKFKVLEHTYSFQDLVEISDGYVLLGQRWISSNSPGTGSPGYDIYVTKINKSGGQLWEKSYGSTGVERPNSIIPSGDGGYIIGTTSNSPADGDKSDGFVGTDPWHGSVANYDLWILKIDGNGTKVWNKTIGNTDMSESGVSICASNDGGYFISSSCSPNMTASGFPPAPMRLTKINAMGVRLWTYTYFPSSGNYGGAPSMIKTSDGNYVIGVINNKNSSNQDYAIIKVDPNGAVIWKKEFGGNNLEYLSSIKEFPNGDLLLGGYSNSLQSGTKSESTFGGYDYWIVRTDNQGNKIWDKDIRATSDDRLSNIVVLNNDSYILSGYSSSSIGGDKSEAGRGSSDIWILKVGEGQNSGATTLGNINPTAYFPSAKVAIPFTASCTKPGETFTAQLSDQSGSFTSPVNIGIFSGGNSGTINGTIPANAIPGTGYKIRVISSLTNSVSLDNGQYITIKPSQITTGTISPLAYMPGATLSVPYTILGVFKSGNVFTAQLSDANGYFVNYVNIGSLTSAAAGTISATIPSNTPVGRGYRIRVVGSDPLINGSNNGVNISVGRLFTETISDKVYYPGDAIVIPYTALGTFNSGNVFTAILSDASGNFATSTTILGTLTSTSSGSINTVIPLTTLPGAGYRIKVTSSNPAIDGTANTKDIVISTPFVTISAISSTRVLSGSSIIVGYSVKGKFENGNQYTVQLSDENGSFLRPLNIGSVISTASGTINAEIPLATPMGTGYRVRIISSSPSTVSNDNGTNISIFGILTNTVSPAVYYAGTQMTVSYQTNITYVPGNVFNVELSDVNGNFTNPMVIGSSSQPGPIIATIPVDALSGNLYRVRVVATNPAVTGLPNPSNITINKNSITVNLATNINVCPGSSLTVPFTSSGIFNQGNVYTILFSDANGSFDNSTILAVASFTGGGNSGAGSWGVNTTLSANTLSGTGYKIRVQSSSPFAYGEAPLTVSELPRALSLVSSTNISYGETINIKAGKVLSFDGVDDQVTAPGFIYPANGGAVTVEFWLKVNAEDVRNSSAFSVGSSHSDRLQAHIPWGDGSISFDYGNLSNPASRIAASYTPYLGKWTHVAFVSSGKANTFKAIYLNGQLVNSVNSSDGNTGTLYGLKIGSFVNNTLFMKGMIDEFRIWNVMRSQTEIQSSMYRFINEGTPGLMLSLQMHEGSGTVVKDNSGNGLNGTISGATWTNPFTNLTYNWLIGTTPVSGTSMTMSPTEQTIVALTTQDNVSGCTSGYSTTANVRGGIATNSVNPVTYYRGGVMNVSFRTNMTFNPSNMFQVQLSDANGSFASSIAIGVGIQIESINCAIPVNTPVGTGYRVRVVSTNPQIIGLPNPENISIIASNVAINLNNYSTLCTGSTSVPVTMNGYFAPDNVFTLMLSDQSGFFGVPLILNSFTSSVAGSTQISFELPRGINFSGNYKLRLQSSNPSSYADLSVNLAEGLRAVSSFSATSICPGQTISLTGGKVLDFDGNDVVTVPGYSQPANGGAITVEFWLKVRSNFNTYNGMAFSFGSGLSRLQAIVPNNSKTLVFEYGELLNSSRSITADYTNYINRWTHVALVSSGKANTYKAIYINGELVASVNNSDGNSASLSGLQLGVGLSGMMDEFRVWNKIRTQAEIKDGMYKTIGVGTSGLKLYLQMHEGSGSILNDNSGNGLNGTRNGASWTSMYLINANYSWYSSAGTQAGPNASVTPMQTSVYSLIVQDPVVGCEARDYTTVTVKPTPCTQGLMAQFTDTDEESSVSGLQEGHSQGIDIYPNPNEGSFSIILKEAHSVIIEIIDAKGNKVKEVKGADAIFNIDALELSAGLYMVNVIGNGTIVSRKIAIRK